MQKQTASVKAQLFRAQILSQFKRCYDLSARLLTGFFFSDMRATACPLFDEMMT